MIRAARSSAMSHPWWPMLLAFGVSFPALYGVLLWLGQVWHPAGTLPAQRVPMILAAGCLGALLLLAWCVVAVVRLRRGQVILVRALAATRDAVVITDAGGRVVDCNRAAERLFGRPLEAMSGTPLEALLGTAVAPPHADAVQGQAETVQEVDIRRPGGELRRTEVIGAAPAAAARRRGVHVLRDVTEARSAACELRESELQLRLATEMAGIAVWNYDFVRNCMFRTRNHDALYGMEWQTTWVAATFLDATHPDDRARSAAAIEHCMVPGGPDDYAFDFRVIKPDGGMAWLWVCGRVTERDASGRGTALRGVILDVTARKVAEEQLERMTRLYATLSQCNQAIVRCADEATLFAQICRDAVLFGGMRTAWIGRFDAAAQRLHVVAAAGEGAEALQAIEIPVAADTPAGQGPVGRCLHEARPAWCQDYLHDAATQAWRELALRNGWGASATLPLERRGHMAGVLVVYADRANVFDDGARKLLVEMSRDVSFALDRFVDERQHRQALEDLRVSDQRLRTIIETEPEGVKVIGPDGRLEALNRAALENLEIDSIEAARRLSFTDFVLSPYRQAYQDLHRRALHGDGGMLQFEMRGARGTHRWLEMRAAPLRDADGAATGMISIARDITERKRAESRIRHLANFDALTDLPNRNLLAEHMQYAIDLSRRRRGKLCVMFIDLDRFKDINDALGHSLGDAVLVEVGRRLRGALRAEDLLARTGGDEFVVVLPDTGAPAAAQLAEKLLATLAAAFSIGTYDLMVTASIGIALHPDDGADLEAISRSADTAMYRAKQDGRNGYRFFTAEMEQRAARHMQLTHAMRQALELGQFRLHYQPQVDLASGRVIGVEALLRWRHPELGDVSPTEFIPVAEYNGLIVPIGAWALRTAARQGQLWREHGYAPLIMAVNLSARQFRDRALVGLIDAVLEETGLPARNLEIELTESVTMTDVAGAIAIMQRLHDRGIRMAIDDFGTGYSSLSYLRQLQVDRIKIDQSFVRGLRAEGDELAIVQAVIGLARSLGLRSVAEGVEDAAQLVVLKAHGCDEVQGYCFCGPEPPDVIAAYLPRAGRTASMAPGPEG